MRSFSFLFWLESHAALAYVVSTKSLVLIDEKAQVFLKFLELLREDILSSCVKKLFPEVHEPKYKVKHIILCNVSIPPPFREIMHIPMCVIS